MKVVSVIAQKGGTGKTTLSIATACAAARRGLSTLLVDLDPQASASSWADRRGDPPPAVLSAPPPRLPRILEAAAGEGVQLAVVDTAPRAEQSAVAAAKAADIVLVPCRAAALDLETVLTTVDLVRAVNPTVPVLCVLNAVPPRGPRERQARDFLAGARVPAADTSIGLRASIDYATTAGLDAGDYEPNGKAAAELAAVYTQLARLARLPRGAHGGSTNGQAS